MNAKQPAKKSAKKPAVPTAAGGPRDGREAPSVMEPLLLAEGSRHRQGLADLALGLVEAAAGFERSLHPSVMQALADLVRAMNCYYSNLIEGHDMHPIDIERALKRDYSADPTKRSLQLEAAAHIRVQAWIDDGGLTGRAANREALCEVHRRFAEHLPSELLEVKHPDTGEALAVVPGQLRQRDVRVGTHRAISPGAVPRFLDRFEQVYGNLGRSEALLAAAAAHHRLLWIHPFLDGNGRVARLMSHAMLIERLGTRGTWSVARGLARRQHDYKNHLAQCDMRRRNDLDGRGNLSEESLAAFTRFFLETCIDQVQFMESLVQPDRLRDRMLTWAHERIRAGDLPSKADRILEAVLYRGELPRAEVPALLDLSERSARRAVSALIDHEVLTSDSTRKPLRLGFPARLASRWMPGLFPDPQQPGA